MVNSGTTVIWENIIISAVGTATRGNLLVTSSLLVELTTCSFTGMGTFGFDSNTTADGCTFRDTQLITQGGADITDCRIVDSAVSTAMSVDNIDLVTGCTFISAGTGHAVDLGTIAASVSKTWNNTDSGYASSDGLTGNETILVSVNSGQTLTVNVSSGASTPTIKNDGTGTVTVIAGAVTTKITVTSNTDNSAVEGAAVVIKAASTVGGLPFEDVVTITRSGTVATVTHTAHGLSSNNWVEIEDAVQNEYNRLKQITVTTVNAYTFVVTGSPTTPATGTILATAVLINGLSDVLGEISDTRTLSVDQGFTGSVKKGSSSPVFVGSDLSGTILKDSGFIQTVALIPD